MNRAALEALRGTKAVSAAEYAILAVGVVVILGSAATVLRQPLANAFTAIGSNITGTQNAQGTSE